MKRFFQSKAVQILALIGALVSIAAFALYKPLMVQSANSQLQTDFVSENDTYNQKYYDDKNYKKQNKKQKYQNDNYSHTKTSQYQNFESGDFDFYVLALSWSPTFCIKNKKRAMNDEQCSGTKYNGFVVHGLWPQYEHGYPKSCDNQYGQVSAGTISQMLDIMPSSRLIRGEWEKHGTCSGLDVNGYFKALRASYNKVKIPNLANFDNQSVAQIEQAFIKANYGMKNDGIAVIRNDNMLAEVRVCMDKNLNFRSCDEVDQKAARQFDKLYIPRKN
jgi:ribonuclease T2